ncbi:MAG: family 10 glycosylhydrolase [Candidatus Marinimicrobia bacterium]|nr:family 10 glycosylhydrolase [Candidatus Neomarinimicrobiota bacterium]
MLTKNGFEWMNAYHPEVQDFLTALILEVVKGYDIDGIQGDDRLPAQPVHGGYSEYTANLYRTEHGGKFPPADARDPEWMRWRADKLNAFAERVYEEVKAADPSVLVTWAPSVYPWCYDEYLQDWPSWIEGGYADAVIPQVYRYDINAYEKTLNSQGIINHASENADIPLIPGVLLNVGSYLMPAEMVEKTVMINREQGYEGEIFFFYEGLRKEDDRNAEILRQLYSEGDNAEK